MMINFHSKTRFNILIKIFSYLMAEIITVKFSNLSQASSSQPTAYNTLLKKKIHIHTNRQRDTLTVLSNKTIEDDNLSPIQL